MGGAFTTGIGDAFEALARGAADSLPRLLAGIIVFLIAWIVARAASAATRRVLGRTSTQAHVDLLVARTVRWTVLAIGLVTALAVLGVNVGALVTSLGLAGLTLGFALRDVLANSVAGVTLLMQRPFTIGDTIVVNGTEGVVRDVRVRDTVLRTPDGRLAYLPNMTVFNAVVINVTQAPVRRFEIAVWTPAGTRPRRRACLRAGRGRRHAGGASGPGAGVRRGERRSGPRAHRRAWVGRYHEGRSRHAAVRRVGASSRDAHGGRGRGGRRHRQRGS